MAFGGNCPQCALSHYACQHLLSSTNYNPDSQHLSKYVIRANVTATKFVCLEKSRLPATWASQTLSGEMSPNSAFCGLELNELYGNSIILGQNQSSIYFSPKGRTKYFNRKYIFLGQNVSGQNVTDTFCLMIEPSCRFSPFLGKRS